MLNALLWKLGRDESLPRLTANDGRRVLDLLRTFADRGAAMNLEGLGLTEFDKRRIRGDVDYFMTPTLLSYANPVIGRSGRPVCTSRRDTHRIRLPGASSAWSYGVA